MASSLLFNDEVQSSQLVRSVCIVTTSTEYSISSCYMRDTNRIMWTEWVRIVAAGSMASSSTSV